ncbi:glutathione S-transferase [bacterium]|nr:glutathione S-transferase [bacterium]NBX81513.1 glutathione S-transferase [bacterium]
MPKITLILSSVMGLMCVWLALQVIKNRRKHQVSLGDGGIDELTRAIRAHGNFVEYVPLSLILLACSELNQAPLLVVTGFAVLIFLGRAFHAYAFLGGKDHFKPRIFGMKLTLYGLVALSVFNLGLFIWNV